jgi:hypothetical protein
LAALVVAAGHAYRQHRIAESRQAAARAGELRGRDQPPSVDRELRAPENEKTAEARRAAADAFPAPLTVLEGYTASGGSAAFSPDSKRIVTAHKDSTVGRYFEPDGSPRQEDTARVWEAQSGRPVATLWGHRWTVMSAAFSPDGRPS